MIDPVPQGNYRPAMPLAEIFESKHNPRKHFDPAGLKELEQSIREKGVLTPLIVRPNGKGHEIAAGHRRFRAAKAAGLETVPVLVKDMTDKELAEVLVIDNLQRADVHPLEEAEGYRQLHEKHGYSIEDLAAKVGKSKGYVYARLKLGAMPDAAKEAFLNGKLNPSTALLVARIPDAGQAEKFAKEITTEQYKGAGLPGYRRALEIYQRDYMLRLAEAPFKTGDADLIPAAGACGPCPKRTGNNPDLFGDIQGKDLCTDVVCFRRKTDAAWEQTMVAAAAKGRKVLDAKESAKLFQYGSLSYSTNVPYVTLDRYHQEDPKARTYAQLIGKQAKPHLVLARGPKGEAVELLPKSEIPGLLKEAGHNFKKRREERGPSRPSKEALEKQKREMAIEEALAPRLREAIREAAEKEGPTTKLLRLLALEILPYTSSSGPSVDKKTAGSMNAAQLAARILVDQLDDNLGYAFDVDCPVGATCKTLGLDLKKLRKDVAADLDAKVQTPAKTRSSQKLANAKKAAKKKAAKK